MGYKLIEIMDSVHASQSYIIHRKILSTLPAIQGSTFSNRNFLLICK